MKFFWKIFCSTIIITAFTCSVGGYFLIHSQFQLSLDREIAAAYAENDILGQILDQELKDLTSMKEEVPEIADNITVNVSGGTIAFTVSDEKGSAVYRNSDLSGSRDIYGKIGGDNKGYEIYKTQGKYYIHAVRPIYARGEVMYLESFREITYLFEAKRQQYTTFAVLMAVLFVGVGLVSFVVSSLLLSPLKKLSSATKQMADGSFRPKLNIARSDEIGELASDFEQMSVKLEDMVNELKEYSRRQQDFVDNFSHELKTPLTSIIGYADMIRSREMEPERRMACADYIYTEGKRLETLSLKLMDLIVLENQEFTFRPVHMREFLGQIANAFAPVVAESGILFSSKARDGVVSLEPDLMKTVCMNLLDNARKAAGRGDRILFTGRRLPDGTYCISVEDSGKGIPKGELSKITEAFYMVDKSRARAQGGAGMGLALCSRIVKLHRGRMKFVSREGKGTRVSVCLRDDSASREDKEGRKK